MTFLLKVVDEETWAKRFQQGYIQITPLNEFKKIEDETRRDIGEGSCKAIRSLNINTIQQHLEIYGHDGLSAFNDIIKRDYGEEFFDNYNIVVEYSVDYCALCLTVLDFVNDSDIVSVIEKALTKGKYFCIIHNIPGFIDRIAQIYPEIHMGRIEYIDGYCCEMPFIKPMEYALEREYRILFPTAEKIKQEISIGDISDFCKIYECDINSGIIEI